jgi:arylformamidase
MTITDISRLLRPGTAVWPGDTPYRLAQTLRRSAGDSVNLNTLTLSVHTGSHVDSPYHVADDGETTDQLDLSAYWGPAQVVSLGKIAGPLTPADLARVDLSQAPRLLLRTGAGDLPLEEFPHDFAYPAPELADYLGRAGIVLLGTDAPSMDAADSKSLEGHRALLRNRIAILEWLDLSRVADGLYELVALPLRIAGGDGSPVRAALRPLL